MEDRAVLHTQLALFVNADITLAAGAYNGQVVVTSSNGIASMTIPVTLTVGAAGSAFFDNLQGQMSFSMKTAGNSPPSQPIQVRNGGSGSLAWTLAVSTSDGGNWLSASATSGTAPSILTITVAKQNLPGGGNSAGTFIGKLLFQSAGGSVSVPVSFVVADAVFTQLSPINITKVFAGANPLPVTLAIASTGASFSFNSGESTGTGGDWMSISLGGGCTGGGTCATPHALTATFNPLVTLPAGTYTGQIFVIPTSGSFGMMIPVYLTVAPPSTPFFDNVPGQMSFSMKTSGSAPPSQIIDLRNGDASGALNWTLTATTSDGGNWLNVSATSGTTPSSVTVGITPANLPDATLVAGTFTGHLLFQSASSRVTVPVSVTVGADVFNQVNGIAFTKLFGGPDPLHQTIVIGSTGASLAFSAAEFTSTGGDWLSVSLGGGCTGGGVCSTPHVLTASVNASPTLPAGIYTGQILVVQNIGSISMTIPVTLAVLPASAAYFDNLPGQLSFSMKTNGTAPPAQPIQIRNAGSGTLNWTAIVSTADGGNWLTASAANGTAPSLVNVAVSKQGIPGGGLLAGTFTGQVLFQTPGGASITVPVTFTVGNDVYDQVNPINFVKTVGGANPLPQMLTITSTGAEIAFSTVGSTATGGDWLKVAIGTGCTGGGVCGTPHVIQATVDAPPTLPAGTYTGQIVVISSATAASMTVPVTLTVVPASTPVFDNVQGHMNFSALTASGNPAAQTVQIRNAGPGTLNWTLSAVTADGGNWLTTSATSGTAPSNVNIGVVVANLPGQGLIADRFSGMLTFASATGTVTVPVTVIIGTPAFVQPAPMTFGKAFGGTNPLSQTLSVTSNGAAIGYYTAAYSGNGGNWLTANIGGGCTGGGACSTPHNVTVSAAPNQALAAGTYTGQIVLAGSAFVTAVPVTLTITGQTPTSVTATSGTPQSTTVGTAFANRLVATVRDGANSPVSGVTVTFTGPASGAGVTFAGGANTAVTDANGQATSAIVTANGTAGSYTVTATVSGIATPANFALTNSPVVVACVTSVSPTGTTVGSAQTIANFSITTTAGCNWTASSNASWLEIFPLTGTNSASIQWTAYPNFGTAQRTAVVTVGGGRSQSPRPPVLKLCFAVSFACSTSASLRALQPMPK